MLGYCGKGLAFVVVVAVMTLCFQLSGRTIGAGGTQGLQAANKQRASWTTSRIIGSPEPPPKFKTTRVFPEVKFHHPLVLARCPGTERLFCGEQEGVIYSVFPAPDAKKALFFDLRKELKTLDKLPGAKGVGELYGLVFHPKFETNRYCYLCYTLSPKEGSISPFPDGSRVSRFTVLKTDPPRIDPTTEEIVLTFPGGGHNGGDLHFGPDGMLYITTGDAANPSPPDPLSTGQDCSDLLSSVLRIDVDQKADGRNYSVPRDNPFVENKEVRPEIWAYGFRNPWRMSFDRKTGDLWLGDVGWELWEMVHKVEKGGNYGWSIREGRQTIKTTQKIGPTPIQAPLIELPHTIAASVTGGYVYRGKKFPELVGAYLFGDWQTRRLWAARVEGTRLKEMPEITQPSLRIVAFGEDNHGELYLLDYDAGTVHMLERNDAANKNIDFPTKLSETGLYANLQKLELAVGVFPFEPNSRMFHDGAVAEYAIALPGTTPIDLYPTGEGKPIPGQADWMKFRMTFPDNTVLVKTLVVGSTTRSPTRVETQILHFDGIDWRPYTFAWRDDQSDADLVPADGAERSIRIPAPGKPDSWITRDWSFPSRTQCLTCHNPWAGTALAFEAGQLHDQGRSGNDVVHIIGNALQNLTRSGVIRRVDRDGHPLPAFDQKSLGTEPPVYAHHRFSHATAEQRARGYLHANCAHCHRFGGGGGAIVLELDARKPLKETGVLDVTPKQGDLGVPNPRLIAPGAPERSVLFWRMAKFGPGHMPRMGSEQPDYHGTEVVRTWIQELGSHDKERWRPKPDWENWQRPGAFADPVEAYQFARKMPALAQRWNDARIPGKTPLASVPDLEQESKLRTVIEGLPPGLNRDLLEGHLPIDPQRRKLGTNPRPATILRLTGNPRNGEALFSNKDMKCASCHKVGNNGVALGPDLTTIGKLRSREELLESLLQPSLRIEPEYAAYLIQTTDEQSRTGLLVKRDEKVLVLRDAENQEHRFPIADIASVTPARISLMPEGQMSGLTAQEAADLLQFLVNQ